MIVGIGSRREPKVEAVHSVFAQLTEKYPDIAESTFYPRDVNSGTQETPVTIEQLMNGAYNRVQHLKSQLTSEGIEADVFIGLEGGTHQKVHHGQRFTFLQSWAYVETPRFDGYGSSGNLMLPEVITSALYEEERSLGRVIDEFIGKSGIRNNEGTFGVLTDGFIPRQHSFETALFFALAPLYNSRRYH
ncbi:MAG: DUF84 family protein [Candidatus Marinimicrobia bacterium]|nr:DUF84 family protein [Candidatus Neomarinimicrobiota bacterium]MCF7828890.1 DUF84 family protein [Candidatus Neomarinimicrobiota bacterium]MCF7879850.1 DUF84 family protein [Candidatus Neomarinimicrobiota bacterium]